MGCFRPKMERKTQHDKHHKRRIYFIPDLTHSSRLIYCMLCPITLENQINGRPAEQGKDFERVDGDLSNFLWWHPTVEKWADSLWPTCEVGCRPDSGDSAGLQGVCLLTRAGRVFSTLKHSIFKYFMTPHLQPLLSDLLFGWRLPFINSKASERLVTI